MGGLQRFEHKLEQVISGAFAKAFRSAVQPVEIAAALQRECDNNAQILSRERRMVPNDFHVELAQTDLDRLSPYDTTMARDFTEQLEDHAEQQGYEFPGPIRIEFEAADDLTTGRFRIRSSAQAQVRSPTPRAPRHAGDGASSRSRRPAAPAAPARHRRRPRHRGRHPDQRPGHEPPPHRVPGRRVRRVDARRSGCATSGSTNGMLVDGHRVTSTSVRDGSEVKIGNTTLTVRIVTEAAQGAADV